MRGVFLLCAFAHCSAHAAWVRTVYEIYPTMYEYTSLRAATNPNPEPIGAPDQNHSESLRSYCSGAETSAPPWSSYFSTLFDTTTTWTGTTGGSVSANKTRYWQLRVNNNGGTEQWLWPSPPISGPHTRTRIDRGSAIILTYEE